MAVKKERNESRNRKRSRTHAVPVTETTQRLILARWRGFEDDGSSGCYHYEFKDEKLQIENQITTPQQIVH